MADAAEPKPGSEPEPEPGSEPEPEPEPARAAEEGVPPENAAALRKSTKRSSKYHSAPAGADVADPANPLTDGTLPSFTSTPTPFPLSKGGDEDGNFRITMDKKSPTKVSAWQKRWCVFTHEGKVYYFDSYEASCGGAALREPLDLTQCKSITSNNLSLIHI